MPSSRRSSLPLAVINLNPYHRRRQQSRKYWDPEKSSVSLYKGRLFSRGTSTRDTWHVHYQILRRSPCCYVPAGVGVFLLWEQSAPTGAAAGVLRGSPEEPGAPPRVGSPTHPPSRVADCWQPLCYLMENMRWYKMVWDWLGVLPSSFSAVYPSGGNCEWTNPGGGAPALLLHHLLWHITMAGRPGRGHAASPPASTQPERVLQGFTAAAPRHTAKRQGPRGPMLLPQEISVSLCLLQYFFKKLNITNILCSGKTLEHHSPPFFPAEKWKLIYKTFLIFYHINMYP